MLTLSQRRQTINAIHNLVELGLVSKTLVLDYHTTAGTGVFHQLVLAEVRVALLANKFKTASELPMVDFGEPRIHLNDQTGS